MKVLKNINSDLVVSIDIETVRIAENFEDLNEGFQSAWEYKNKQDGEIPELSVLSDLWTRNASLYAEFYKVCAVSLSFLHGGVLHCREFYGENEQELLKSLAITLNNIVAKDKNYRLLAHAGKYFDYPGLAKRYIINGLPIPEILDVSDKKPWENNNLDTNDLWRLGGTGPGSSLQALCNVLQIPVSKGDLVGDEVGQAYYKGELERIGRYCSYDTVATFNVFRVFKGEDIFTFDDVEYSVGYSDAAGGTEEAKEVPLLERLYNNKEVSDKDKADLKKLVEKKKLTKKDKEKLRDMLIAIVSKNDFDDKDTKKDLERKQKEIQELVDSI